MIPDVTTCLPRFRAYRAQHPAWGSLHIVLADGNYHTTHIEHCAHTAAEQGDTEGHELAKILLMLSQTQRKKLAKACQWP